MSATRLLDWLGTDVPIVQAPMAGAQGSALAIAVRWPSRSAATTSRHLWAGENTAGGRAIAAAALTVELARGL